MSDSKNSETILVVDDHPLVLEVVTLILRRAGFSILVAASGPDAMQRAAETPGSIDLLLSDVDMPDISGPELGETLKALRPEMRVMLMSGRSHGSLLVLNYGWAYIQKPFVPVKLVAMIRSVLDSPDRSQPGGQGFEAKP